MPSLCPVSHPSALLIHHIAHFCHHSVLLYHHIILCSINFPFITPLYSSSTWCLLCYHGVLLIHFWSKCMSYCAVSVLYCATIESCSNISVTCTVIALPYCAIPNWVITRFHFAITVSYNAIPMAYCEITVAYFATIEFFSDITVSFCVITVEYCAQLSTIVPSFMHIVPSLCPFEISQKHTVSLQCSIIPQRWPIVITVPHWVLTIP